MVLLTQRIKKYPQTGTLSLQKTRMLVTALYSLESTASHIMNWGV